LVSFDVVSLFTNVPVQKTIELVKSKLEIDQTLTERTKLSVTAIIELLKLCITKTYFQFNNDFYEQNFGLAMGSCLSPILSNIYMEHFETKIVNNQKLKPIVWWRYVDDIFAIWPYDLVSLNDFLTNINEGEKSIKFEIEIENNNFLPFLDVLINKTPTGYETSVYRKPTHTNRYLNFDSNHSMSVKKGIVKSLYDRAKIICSNDNQFTKEKTLLKNVLNANNYPAEFVNKEIKNIEKGSLLINNNNNINNSANIIFKNLTIPYVKGLSERIKKISAECSQIWLPMLEREISNNQLPALSG
jgi:phosphohistidine swiveling domain-containing protein